jgi:hypothetical protein
MMKLRQDLISAAMFMISSLAVVNIAGAQPATPAVAPANMQKQSRPYYVEGVVVVVLMAAAGVAVCRSSRRV